ncbi:MAG: hypothetical protein ACE5SW_00880 [Nitrososphaeraceae archaeon]
MGRPKKFVRVVKTILRISLGTFEKINQFKTNRETQDHFIKQI